VSSRARKAYETAEHSLTLARNEKKDAEQDLVKLFDIAHFGSQGEWKKLDGTCLEKNTGEYVFLFRILVDVLL
jgi:protein kinase C substrate 80K-H